MTKRKTHPQVEFQMDVGGKTHVHRRWSDAVEMAVANSVSTGKEIVIDVLVYTKSGARWWSGDWGVESFEEDPDASVFQRITIQAHDLGRIP